MIFESEEAFEDAAVANLKRYGWDNKDGVLERPLKRICLITGF